MKFRRILSNTLAVITLSGCAGFQRQCSTFNAQNYGADWVVAQVGFDGKPTHCWVLHNVSVANEGNSDGVHWLGRDGDLVHLAGWIDRVQVSGGDFARAARQIGITDISTCQK